MSIDEFYKLVADMRTEQKRFFSSRDEMIRRQALNESKRLERLVDKAISDHDEEAVTGSLF